MYQISKLSVLRAFTQTIRHSASKGGSSKDGKGDSKCAPSSKGGSSGPSKDGKGDSKSSPVIKGGSPASSKAGKSGSKCAPPSKVAASASAKDRKGESKCTPIEKLDLCESKKGAKAVKDAKASRCGGVPTTDKKPEILGGAVRESSCKPKKKPPTKGTSTAGTFRKICLFAVLPAVVLLNILILTTRTHPERPEFKKWPHLYKRDKPFSWGDGTKSFFHNPHTNALPDSGYEDE